MRWDLPSHLQTWAPSLSAWEADLYGSHEGLPPLLLAFCWLWSVGQQHALGMKKKTGRRMQSGYLSCWSPPCGVSTG